MIVRNLFFLKMFPEQFKEQIRLPASAYPRDDFDQTVIALGDQFVQIDVSVNPHLFFPFLLRYKNADSAFLSIWIIADLYVFINVFT